MLSACCATSISDTLHADVSSLGPQCDERLNPRALTFCSWPSADLVTHERTTLYHDTSTKSQKKGRASCQGSFTRVCRPGVRQDSISASPAPRLPWFLALAYPTRSQPPTKTSSLALSRNAQRCSTR